MKRPAISLRLTEEDRELARQIAEHIGSDMTGAIRYALREGARAMRRKEIGMNEKQLVDAIKELGVETVAKAVHNPGLMLKHGLSLINWRHKDASGATLFYRIEVGNVEGVALGGEEEWAISPQPRVLVVNAPESDRTKWEAIAAEADAPTAVVMAPKGFVAK